jgi:phosphate transport system substrate-binding protein
MSFRSALTATGVVLSTALLLCVGVGCNGEDYSAKEPTLATTNIGRFSAAGSTFIAPLFARWSTDYEKEHHMIVNYLPIGSGEALNELKEKLLTFAASDAPLNDAQLKDLPPLVQIPVTAGPVCVVYNLATLGAPLKLSGQTLAGIYSGQIKTWDAALIGKDNPGVKLPHVPITVLHRLDGSGTTSIFTTYLSAASQSWSTKPGHGLVVQWPVGIGHVGSKGVLAAVKATPGAIGYLELSYAKEAGLPVASMENRAGEFIVPTPASAALAISAFNDDLAKDLRAPVVDPPALAKGAYPITGLSFILIPKENILPGRQREFKEFVQYCLTDGQNSAETMSYTRLPVAVLDQGKSLLAQLTENGKPLN